MKFFLELTTPERRSYEEEKKQLAGTLLAALMGLNDDRWAGSVTDDQGRPIGTWGLRG